MTFNGDEVRQTFTAGWAATPVASVDTKLYYNWQKMNNDGTDVIFCPSGASSCGGTFENDLWHYEKNNIGLDAWWRINRANRLGVGYDWYQIKQNRIDFDENTTNTFWIEWKNKSIETAAGEDQVLVPQALRRLPARQRRARTPTTRSTSSGSRASTTSPTSRRTASR